MLLDHPVLLGLLIAVGILLLLVLIYVAVSGGRFERIGMAWRASWRLARDDAFASQVEKLLATAEHPTGPPRPSGAPLRLLALLQREGRLVDFLLEDIQSYENTQIGAAVRDIHRQCQAALKEHLVLQPLIARPEGETVEIPPGFDPAAIRLTGNVTGQPPFRGTLQHHGWRVTELKLAPPPEGQDEFVLQPAEVELP